MRSEFSNYKRRIRHCLATKHGWDFWEAQIWIKMHNTDIWMLFSNNKSVADAALIINTTERGIKEGECVAKVPPTLPKK